MEWNEQLFRLQDLLADIVSNQGRSRRYVVTAGIPTGNITFKPAASDNWFEILDEARQHDGKVISLIDVVYADYKKAELLVIKQALSQMGSDEKAHLETLLEQLFNNSNIKSGIKGLSTADSPSDSSLNIIKQLMGNPKILEILKQETGETSGDISEDQFEKLLSNKEFKRMDLIIQEFEALLPIVTAAKSVCKIVRADGEVGTGFLVGDNYLLTNNHVLVDKNDVASAIAEFNYVKNTSETVKYSLDANDYYMSSMYELDYVYVKVIDKAEAPLNQWGALALETDSSLIKKGDKVTIIQHPDGMTQRLADEANDVMSVYENHLYYRTNTMGGSSGSPVFNK
ncbi:MAG: trypsin-like peptidase domain-containing protein, partial [Bacteroidota bacterium]